MEQAKRLMRDKPEAFLYEMANVAKDKVIKSWTKGFITGMSIAGVMGIILFLIK